MFLTLKAQWLYIVSVLFDQKFDLSDIITVFDKKYIYMGLGGTQM